MPCRASVELCLGTLNTNRYDHVDGLLSDPRMKDNITGIGFQWEGGQILPRIRAKYPDYRYISTESECGNGNMDWRAGEHTFHLINHYIGNGCSEYYNWNLILPEWYAYRHYSSFIREGAKIIGHKATGGEKTPVLVAMTPKGKYVVVAGNMSDEQKKVSVDLGGKYVNLSLEPHSFHSFVQK